MTIHAGDCHPETGADLAFERLLAGLSARFVNLPADRVRAEIKNSDARDGLAWKH